MDDKMKGNKTVWITTIICALIGLSLGIWGFIIFGLIGFGLSFASIKWYSSRLDKMTPEERKDYDRKVQESQEAWKDLREDTRKAYRKISDASKTTDKALTQLKDGRNRKKLRRQIAADNKMRVGRVNENALDHVACPYCGSDHVTPMGVNRKGFSFGKAVGGTLLAGETGSLAGFAGKKTGKTDFVCMECGKQFIR